MEKEDVEYIANVLRQGTIKWAGRKACLRRARKKVFVHIAKKSGKKVFKYFWQCAVCSEWSRNEDSMEVDHVVEIGGFKGCWNDFIARMYDRNPGALQALCISCHKRKTEEFNNARLRWKRKTKE